MAAPVSFSRWLAQIAVRSIRNCSENPGAELARGCNKAPRPPCPRAGVRDARRGRLLWDEARTDGRRVAVRNRPTSSRIRRRPVAGDVAVEDNLLHVLPRSRGATRPGTGRRPGQTGGRARGLSWSNGLWPATDLPIRVYQNRRHFHHTGCRISGISDWWRIPRQRSMSQSSGRTGCPGKGKPRSLTPDTNSPPVSLLGLPLSRGTTEDPRPIVILRIDPARPRASGPSALPAGGSGPSRVSQWLKAEVRYLAEELALLV